VNLPSGKPVWYQPDGNGGFVLPFHPTAPNLGLQFLEDLAHNWNDTHAPGIRGNYDGWVPAKGTTTMAHLTRNDIPFPLRAGRRLHHLRRLPLLVHGVDRPQSLLHVDRLYRQ